MKHNWISKTLVGLILMGVCALIVQVAEGCFTWDDPLCYLNSTEGHECSSCEQTEDFPVFDHGVHWVVVVTSGAGWAGYRPWERCTYSVGGNCPNCSAYNVWWYELGPIDQEPTGSCWPG